MRKPLNRVLQWLLRKWKWFGGFFILLVIAYCLGSIDAKLEDDSDLALPETAVVPPEKDMAPEMLKALAIFDRENEPSIEYHIHDHSNIEWEKVEYDEYLNYYSDILKIVYEALEKNKISLPQNDGFKFESEQTEQDKLYYSSYYFSKIIKADILNDIKAKQFNSAASKILKLTNLAKAYYANNSELNASSSISSANTTHIESLKLTNIWLDQQIPSKQIIDEAKKLLYIDPNPKATEIRELKGTHAYIKRQFQKGRNKTYAEHKAFFDHPEHGYDGFMPLEFRLILSPYHYHINRSINYSATQTRIAIEKLDLRIYQNTEKSYGTGHCDTPSFSNLGLFMRNSVGEFQTYIKSDYNWDELGELIAHQDLIQIKLALIEYKLEHGNLPASLADINMVRNDPFGKTDQDSYHYSKEEGEIWSVGSDFRDQQRDKEIIHSDDIVYKIPKF